MESVVTTLIAEGITKLASALWDKLFTVSDKYKQDPNTLEERLQAHLTEAGQWSTVHQIRGMADPESIESTTIELSMDTARQFRKQGTTGQGTATGTATGTASTRTETQILADPQHYLILGEPGAGKTTTLRRLVRTVLVEPPTSATDTAQYPVVLPLRDLKPGTSLYTKIADLIGVHYRNVEIKETVQTGIDRHGKPIHEEIVRHETRVGDKTIEYAVPDILNLTNALVFLDGIDELRPDQRDDTLAEIRELGRKLNPARIVTSSRSGDYTFNLPGFSVVEIQPLDEEQIRAIAEKLSVPGETFLTFLISGALDPGVHSPIPR